MVKTMLGHSGWINCLELDLENSRCFSGSSDFSIRIWNLKTFECEGVLSGHANWVNSIRLCKQKNMLVSAGSDNDVRGNCYFPTTLTTFSVELERFILQAVEWSLGFCEQHQHNSSIQQSALHFFISRRELFSLGTLQTHCHLTSLRISKVVNSCASWKDTLRPFWLWTTASPILIVLWFQLRGIVTWSCTILKCQRHLQFRRKKNQCWMLQIPKNIQIPNGRGRTHWIEQNKRWNIIWNLNKEHLFLFCLK